MILILYFLSSVKPQPLDQFRSTVQKFGFFEGKDGVIEIDVFANPKPRFEWKINGEYPDRKRFIPVDTERIKQNEVQRVNLNIILSVILSELKELDESHKCYNGAIYIVQI